MQIRALLQQHFRRGRKDRSEARNLAHAAAGQDGNDLARAKIQ